MNERDAKPRMLRISKLASKHTTQLDSRVLIGREILEIRFETGNARDNKTFHRENPGFA